MKKTRRVLLLLSLCAALLTIPALATDGQEETAEVSGLVVTITEDVEELTAGDVGDTPTAAGESSPLTPEGNLDLVDDTRQIDGTVVENTDLDEKQFITIQSKNGNYFYLVIDRDGDTENVHFLNQVDEADLMALMDEPETEEEPAECICTEKCAYGSVNIVCPVCRDNLTVCVGKEPEPTEEPDTEPEEPETKSGSSGLLLIVLVLALAGGGAVYYFKFRKPKTDTKGPVDLDDYDLGDDDEDDEDYEYEPDDDEPEERNEGD